MEEGFPAAGVRIDQLDRIADIHIRYKDKILKALSADFGTRPQLQSLVTDVMTTVGEVKEVRKQVRRWMKPEKRKPPLPMRLTGGKAEVQFQPLGVVGNIAPWNFPVQDVVDFINANPRPRALSYFGKDNSEIDLVCKNTTSGGVTINDVAQHVACGDLPLAGVGNSGMGAYHGRDGFLQFSHKKAVYRQGFFSMTKFMTPPFTSRRKKMMESMLQARY